MSDLVKRMNATVGMNVISSGSTGHEYSIALSQFQEARDYIDSLEAQLEAVPHDSLCASTVGDACDCHKAIGETTSPSQSHDQPPQSAE